MPRRTLTLLGSFQAALDGQPVSAFESDKVRALLAFLAVESDRPHSREKLAGLLWPDSSEPAARASLSHALSNLRHALPDRPGDAPLLLASRQTVQLNRDADLQVDAIEFSDLSGLGGLEQAAALYCGRFLEGFSLPGCPDFEEWLLLEQEHLHRCAMDALARLADAYEAQGQFDRALPFAWRQLALDPWWESAHRQAMRLLARSGQRDAALAQFQACHRLLAEELGVEPSAETARLCDEIRDGKLPAVREPRREPPHALDVPIAPLPGFLTGRAVAASRPVFVAREPELAWLEGRLAAALAQHGQAAFVVGGPGRGKTMLLGEFARRALDAHPDLLLAMGTCNAYAGVGDPYLPFRGVLAMLTGDAEAQWAAGTLSVEQARRTWDALPEVAPVLARRGSGLVGTLLPGRELLARALAAAPDGAEWLPALRRLTDPRTNPPGGLEQSHLFEQYSNLLLDLSQCHPLLLVLDDLQWIDPASIGLLFHLGRRLSRGRIVLAGAYRPHELAVGRDGERHPLEPALAEYRARFGDAWLDLAAADEASGRSFVDRFVDSEPNALAEGFRAALHARTRGHPLFTVELLRAMEGRGDLVRDDAGRWLEGGSLDWDALPARAEAAIAERVDRVPEGLRELLAVASVEGEEFTAQVVARVQGMDELQALRLLRGQLAARHRLVREQGEQRLGGYASGRSLSRYRFSHFLVQQHLYLGLGDAERRLLHRRVGEALEGLYEGRLEEAAVQLVRHFAGDPERERRYARMAGERAAAHFANEEALRYLTRALELTPESEASARLELLFALQSIHKLQGASEERLRDLTQMERLAKQLGSDEQAEVAALRAYHALDTGDTTTAVAARAAARAARAAGRTDIELEVDFALALALIRQGDLEAGLAELEAAQMLARAGGSPSQEATGLRIQAARRLAQGDLAPARELLEAEVSLHRGLGDRRCEVGALVRLGSCCLEQGDFRAALESLHLGQRIAAETGIRSSEAGARSTLGLLYHTLGYYEQARSHFDGSLHIFRETNEPLDYARSLAYLCSTARCLGDWAGAHAAGEEASRVLRRRESKSAELLALLALGRLHYEMGDLERGRECYYQGQSLCRHGRLLPCFVTGPPAGLASVALAQADTAAARAYVADVLAVLDRGITPSSEIGCFWILLTCYRVLVAADDPRAPEVLAKAYAQLQEWAAHCPDEATRRSFLENVAENHEIVQEWHLTHPGDGGSGPGQVAE